MLSRCHWCTMLGLSLLLERKYYKTSCSSGICLCDVISPLPLLVAPQVLYLVKTVAMPERRLEYHAHVCRCRYPVWFVDQSIFPDNIIFSVRHMPPKLMDATSAGTNVSIWFCFNYFRNHRHLYLCEWYSCAGAIREKMDVQTALAPLLCSALFGLMLFQAPPFIE